MSRVTLVLRSARHYWRTHLAVVAGVAVAVSVLAGALAVGDSVRASLRKLVDERLGRTTFAVSTPGFFRAALAEDLEKHGGVEEFGGHAEALIALEGAVAHEASGRQASGIQVYGIGDGFFAFHGLDEPAPPTGRQALISPALAAELGAGEGDALLLRVQKPSAIPASTLVGRRDETAGSVRVTVQHVLPADRLGEFSLRPRQDAVRAVVVPLSRLQRDLDLAGRANVLLLSGGREDLSATAPVERLLAGTATFTDLGLELRPLDRQHALSLESESGLIGDRLGAAAVDLARDSGLEPLGILTYLANAIRIGPRTIPYSVVSGLDLAAYASLGRPAGTAAPGDGPTAPGGSTAGPPLWLNEWAARDLRATPGDPVTLEYYLWSDESGLSTHKASFTYAGAIPMAGAGSDRTLTPEYPGLTDAPTIGDWDPPFPVDLRRIRPIDEDYWKAYRAAPKAFVPLDVAQELWGSPVYGRLTSIRLGVPSDRALAVARETFAAALRRVHQPSDAGLTVQPVRAQALAAARGATDFGEYFFYFSFFLFVAGLLLTGLFFRLAVESRAREIGLLLALGYTPRDVRRLLFAESLTLAAVGTMAGAVGSLLFAWLIVFGLRTWWVDAVGTTRLELSVSPATIAIGAAAGLIAAAVSLALTLRRLGSSAPRDLLSGLALMTAPRTATARAGRAWLRALIGLVLAGALIGAAMRGFIGETAAFFGAGAAVLVSAVAALSALLRTRPRRPLAGNGPAAVSRLGARQAATHPGRTVLSVTLIAFATFVIVAVGAFRRGAPDDPHDPLSGTGGYALFAESVAPVMFDPGTPAGRDELGLPEPLFENTRIERFRLRPGEDGSCLNLYRPTSPRIIAPTDGFVRRGGFRFASTLADATDEERRNPWTLLHRTFDDGAVPVIGDATSLQYVLHVPVGGDILIPGHEGRPVVLRVVAALADSVLQSELVVSDAQFTRLFPRQEGYRFFLIRTAPGSEPDIAATLESTLEDYGLDVQSSGERLAAYHRVENTYLSTFQALGGLGLLLGTLGLGAILLRNVMERRRELALLRAVGYEGSALGLMVVAESVLLLVAGIGIGTLSAVLAVWPALLSRGDTFPIVGTGLVLGGVLLTGLLASIAATRAAAATPLLAELKSDL
ncbi:MAG TPA: ABC transporter permease [Vicinamibacterales bacterium]